MPQVAHRRRLSAQASTAGASGPDVRGRRSTGSGFGLAQLHHKYWLAPYIVGAVVGLALACSLSAESGGQNSLRIRRQRLLQLNGGADGDVASATAPPFDPYMYEVDPSSPPLHDSAPPEELGQVMRTLSFSHLWQDDRYEKYVFGDPKILNQMMVFISGTIMSYLIIVNVLSCFVLPFIAPQYRELDIFGQMAVTTNTLYTILLVAQLVPYTVIVIGILFGDCRSKQFPAFYYTVFVFLTTHAIMYAYEGIVRSVIKVNYLLLIHHACFFMFMLTEFIVQSNFVVKVCLILDYFVVWEAGLYLTNVCYRLKVNYTLLKWVMIVGTTVHGVTHLLQAMLLTAFFVGMGKRMDAYHISKGIFAFMIIACALLVCYQYYLEKIFYEMWIKVAKAHRAKLAAAKADVEQGSKDVPFAEEQALLSNHVLSSAVMSGDPIMLSRKGSAELPGAAGGIGLRTQSSLQLELAQIAEAEKLMLGELPTFPAKMTSLHLPRASSLPRSPRTSQTGSGDATSQLIKAVSGSSPSRNPPATHSTPASGSKESKAKRKDDGLTDDMWAQTED